MKIQGKEYRTIWFDEENKLVKIIDQTKLPHKFIIKNLKTSKEAINAIKTMEVRGAPLTSIVLIAFIASFTDFKSLIINLCGSFV